MTSAAEALGVSLAGRSLDPAADSRSAVISDYAHGGAIVDMVSDDLGVR